MKNFILVHGAWGGAWEFADVKKLLSINGNKASAIDLPGHGNNSKPLEEVTMEAYVQEVLKVVQAQQEKVILVGHSLAGAVISQVAEILPEKVERLIFVAAILPKNGQSPMDLMQSDEDGLLPHVIFAEDETSATLSPDTVRNVLLNDVHDTSRLDTLVQEFLFAQATQPFMAPAKLTTEHFGQVPKCYIRADIDKVLSPKLQGSMLNSWKMDKVVSLRSGHFPLTSMPDELVSLLNKASR